jgi:hypothetical protein
MMTGWLLGTTSHIQREPEEDKGYVATKRSPRSALPSAILCFATYRTLLLLLLTVS